MFIFQWGAKSTIIGVYAFLFLLARHAVRRFTILKKIHSKNLYERFCFKLHWRFGADGVSKQDGPNRLSKKQQILLDILRHFMMLKSITLIKHDDLFFDDAYFNDELDLAMFRYKKEKKIVSHKNLDHNIKMDNSKGAFIIKSYKYFLN